MTSDPAPNRRSLLSADPADRQRGDWLVDGVVSRHARHRDEQARPTDCGPRCDRLVCAVEGCPTYEEKP